MSQPRTLSTPTGSVQVPQQVIQIADGDTIEGVWLNELGGATFRLQGENLTRYVKWQDYTGLSPRRVADVNLHDEAEKLTWAARHDHPVPQVIDFCEAGSTAWLVTEAILARPPVIHGIPARSAVDPYWKQQPEVAVRGIALGLRKLHDTLSVETCPHTGAWLGELAAQAPETDQLVVCHGDPCVPNTLLSETGEFAAHVDLGNLGVADRWADLAIASWSISWDFNFGRGYDELFFSTYGIEPDPERIRIYRELWDQD